MGRHRWRSRRTGIIRDNCSATRTARRASCAVRSPRLRAARAGHRLRQRVRRAAAAPDPCLRASRRRRGVQPAQLCHGGGARDCAGRTHRDGRRTRVASRYRLPAGSHDTADARRDHRVTEQSRRPLPAARRARAAASRAAGRDPTDRRCCVCRLCRRRGFRAGSGTRRRGLQHRDDADLLEALWARGPAHRLDVRAGQHRRRRRAHPHAVQRIGGRDGCGDRGSPRRALHAVRPRLQHRTAAPYRGGRDGHGRRHRVSDELTRTSTCCGSPTTATRRRVQRRHSSDTASSRGRLRAGGPARCLRITVGLQHENDAVLGVLADYMAH